MPSTPLEPGSGRYIIQSEGARQLAEFLSCVNGAPGIELLELIGRVGQPHATMFAMPHEKVASLTHRFRTSNQLTIEPDRPLSLFGTA